jgi:PRTase ComF-like
MYTTYESRSLGDVNIGINNGNMEPGIADDFTTIDEYSRFKFGDGGVGAKYGTLLGQLVLTDGMAEQILSQEEVYVSSSAYRVAPPASETLALPFVSSADKTARSVDSDTTFRHFKISKGQMATGNYAAMSFGERSQTIQSDLLLPDGLDLEGKHVVILDDIRVTGLREAALKGLLGKVGASHVSFYYVLNVPEGKEYPQTEAIININAVKTVDDVLELAMQPEFVPNVRMCKFLLSQSVAEIERFLSTVPAEVADTVVRYIREDNLREVVKAIP